MIYFLDFDRTLFDTDAFNASLPDEPGCAAFADELREVIAQGRDQTLTGGENRLRAWKKVSEALQDGTLAFSPGYLERFLYADAKEFLRSLGNEAIVITYGDEHLQRMKVESALANVVRVTTVYTGTVPKAEFLSSWPGYHGQEAVFVDDRDAELIELARKYPNMKLFKMHRAGARTAPRSVEGAPLFESEGRWKLIRSLSELP